MGSQLLEDTLKSKSRQNWRKMSVGFKVSIGNKPVHKIQGYICVKQFQDGNERQDPVN
jgi:hypothetical protein